jgi:hypothetical protein
VVIGEGVLKLRTETTRKTWLHTWPRSICSTEGPARIAFGATGLLVVVVLRLWSGDRFAKATFASFQFTQPR